MTDNIVVLSVAKHLTLNHALSSISRVYMRNFTLVYSVQPHSRARISLIYTLELYTMVRDPMNVNLAIRNSHDAIFSVFTLNRYIVKRNVIHVDSAIINALGKAVLYDIRELYMME